LVVSEGRSRDLDEGIVTIMLRIAASSFGHLSHEHLRARWLVGAAMLRHGEVRDAIHHVRETSRMLQEDGVGESLVKELRFKVDMTLSCGYVSRKDWHLALSVLGPLQSYAFSRRNSITPVQAIMIRTQLATAVLDLGACGTGATIS